MGCGNSKLNPEGEVVPPRNIRPLLRRRILELKKRRNASNLKDGTLSKKELLRDNEFENENSLLVEISKRLSLSDHESTESEGKDIHHSTIHLLSNGEPKLDLTDHGSLQKLEKTQQLKDLMIVKNEFPPYYGLKEDFEKDERSTDKRAEDEEKDENNQGEADQNANGVDNDERRICPGSPSFRVYFVEATNNNKENGKEDVLHKKTPSHDSSESVSSPSYSEEQEHKMIKKEKKGRRSFKKAISKTKSGPVAVKNLLNVRSCYHIGCTGNDRASLLARRAAD